MRSTVLTYHAIADCPRADDDYDLFVSPEAFAQQMEFLRRHRQVVTLEDVVNGSLVRGKPAVAITFDDGYRSVLEHAVPILEREGFPATIFVPTRWIGQSPGWIKPTGCPLDIMTADELRAAERRGLAVESHGHDHIDLSVAAAGTAATDMTRSRAILAEILGREARFFAYPFSHGSDTAHQAAATVGFEAAFSFGRPGSRRFDWPRVPVTPHDRQRLFRLKTSGRYLELRYAPVTRAGVLLTRPLRWATRRLGA
jgi:peptidoglycan/xylan/chitin deacetylase (PgdA/CDA1 family)